ncbi:bidirectional sugar transporter SWEET7b-like isoform X1 [Apium graveolens]|uniref:bidirectional sugar transporter SWEET7b-like isoform X1 n=2 Tax=Apium graveolens TaxID=4045 RepID=UPI003D7B5363
MVDKDVVRVVFGIIANVISICLFASEIPTFYKAVKKSNSLEDINAGYYLAMTMNCLFLVLYGVPFFHPGNLLLLTAFGTGLAIHIAYLTIFLLYSSCNKRMYVGSVFLTELLVIGLVSGLLIGLEHNVRTRTLYVGFFCFIMCLFMLTPRSTLMLEVKDTKSAECMSLPVTLGDILSGLCWCIYAALGSDSFFAAPNGLGCLWGLYHLRLYCLYRERTPKARDDDKEQLAQAELSEGKLADMEQRMEQKKLALELKHEEIQQALKLYQTQLAQVEHDIANLGPSTGQPRDGVDMV